MRFYTSAKTYPELCGIPEEHRVPLTLRCHRYHAASGWNRRFDSIFYVSTFIAVVFGVLVGFIRAEFWLLLGAVVASLVLEMSAFALITQAVIRRRLTAYLQTEDCREYLRQTGLRS